MIDPIPILYGALVLGTVGLAWASGRHVAIKVALVLLLAWTVCNVIVDADGFARAPLLLPMADAVFALLVGALAVANRDGLAATVFVIFVAVGITHVAAFEAHTQGTYHYYLALNLLFLAQVLIVGGASGWALVADRLARGHHGARAHLASR